MAYNDSPAKSLRTYSPPQYLLSSTGLSRDDLVGQYEEFRQSLMQVETAPELVFERLIGNLKDVFSEALTRERGEHAAAQEAWHCEKEALKSDRESAAGAGKGAEDVQLNLFSPTLVPALISANQIYLQFWFATTSTTRDGCKPEKSTRIRAMTTTTAAPYGISAGWPDMEHLARSVDHGSYDTRMDPLITSPTIPTTLTQVVRYKTPFDTPPKVVVWLTGLCAATGAAVCVKAVANDITETEFALQIRSSDGTQLASVGVAWAVWSEAGASDNGWSGTHSVVNVGSVSTAKTGDARVPVFSGSGSLRGAAVMAALSEVDMVLVGGVWVQLVVKQAGWQMSAGPVGACVYSARVAYAFE